MCKRDIYIFDDRMWNLVIKFWKKSVICIMCMWKLEIVLEFFLYIMFVYIIYLYVIFYVILVGIWEYKLMF